MTFVNFTPISALIGGMLIGFAAAGLWWLFGRIAGVSSILGSAIFARGEDNGWRWAFLAGLLVAGIGAMLLVPNAVQFQLDAGYGSVIAAGLLVGIGTQLGSGCTSGHGVCGVSRLSPRSLIATGVFVAAGFTAVFVIRHLLS